MASATARRSDRSGFLLPAREDLQNQPCVGLGKAARHPRACFFAEAGVERSDGEADANPHAKVLQLNRDVVEEGVTAAVGELDAAVG